MTSKPRDRRTGRFFARSVALDFRLGERKQAVAAVYYDIGTGTVAVLEQPKYFHLDGKPTYSRSSSH